MSGEQPAQTPRCGARTRQGRPCRKPAGWGTDHPGYGNCRLHFGATPNGRTHAVREAATIAAAGLGLPVETDPIEALGQALALTAREVRYLSDQVERLSEGEVMTKGELHPTVRALQHSVDRMRVTAKTAADAGVEQRRLELDELVRDRLATFLRLVIGGLGLSPEQEARVPRLMQEHAEVLDTLGDRPRELAA